MPGDITLPGIFISYRIRPNNS